MGHRRCTVSVITGHGMVIGIRGGRYGGQGHMPSALVKEAGRLRETCLRGSGWCDHKRDKLSPSTLSVKELNFEYFNGIMYHDKLK